ncbi:MAG: NeuD/PglB/VioB family sugar acetyltransferase [Alphaproteobacteria bacterium]
MENKLVIYGYRGHARSVANVVLHNNKNTKIVFVNEDAQANDKIWGYDVESKCDDKTDCIIAFGDNQVRKNLFRGKNIVSVIAKDACLGINSKVEKGCFIAHGAFIGPECKIGQGTIINTQAIIEHETKVGEFTNICPNVAISGRCNIGNNVFIGTGSAVINNIRICDDVIVGTGSVVIKDILVSGTYVGNPVRKVK